MNKEQIENCIKLLDRVQLNGKEVPAFNEVIKGLWEMLKNVSPEVYAKEASEDKSDKK